MKITGGFRLLILSVLVLVGLALNGQVPGEYVVTEKGDTLAGILTVKNGIPELNGDKSLSNIIVAFRFKGSHYVRKELYGSFEFLRLVESGPLSLYENSDDKRIYAEKDGLVAELENNTETYVVNNVSHTIKLKNYIKVLTAFSADCSGSSVSENLSFSLGALAKFVREYNECSGYSKSISNSEDFKTNIQFLFLSGVSISKVSVVNDREAHQQFLRAFQNPNNVTGLAFETAILFDSPRISKHLKYGVSLVYIQKGSQERVSYDGGSVITREDYDVVFDLKYLDINPFIAYQWNIGNTTLNMHGGPVYGTLLNKSDAFSHTAQSQFSPPNAYPVSDASLFPFQGGGGASEMGVSGGVTVNFSIGIIPLAVDYEYANTTILAERSKFKYKNISNSLKVGILLR